MLVVGYRSYCTILSGESSTFQHVCMPTGVSDTRRNNWIPILSRRPSCECLVHVSMHRSMGEAVIVWDDRKDFVMDLGRLRTWFVITIAVSLAHKRLGLHVAQPFFRPLIYVIVPPYVRYLNLRITRSNIVDGEPSRCRKGMPGLLLFGRWIHSNRLASVLNFISPPIVWPHAPLAAFSARLGHTLLHLVPL